MDAGVSNCNEIQVSGDEKAALYEEIDALRKENRRLSEENEALSDARLEAALDAYVFSSAMARHAVRCLAAGSADPPAEVARLVKENPDAIMSEPKNCPFFSAETLAEVPEKRGGGFFRRR